MLAGSAGAILGVSREVARKFNAGLDQPLATHVYNSFDRARFDPDRVEPAGIRDQLGIAPEASLLGHIAQITPWKGQDDSIRAVALLNRSGLNTHLLVVGSVAFSGKGVRYDNKAYHQGLHPSWPNWALRTRCTSSGSGPTSPRSCRSATCPFCPPGTSRSPT